MDGYYRSLMQYQLLKAKQEPPPKKDVPKETKKETKV
jgi:hypothetical protein